MPHEPEFPSEAEVNALLSEFKTDARQAIWALLHDLAVLAGDYQAGLSGGYGRGQAYTLALRRAVGLADRC